MSLSIQYENVEDASMRLSSTVVLYDGVPHYVDAVEPAPEGDRKEIFRVRCRPLPLTAEKRENTIRKYISSKKFDLAPFKMGFVNRLTGVFYCSREPARQQKQGLCSRTLIMTAPMPFVAPVAKGPPLEEIRRRGAGIAFNKAGAAMSWDVWLSDPNVMNMLKGEYPSFAAAMVGLKELPSMAFNREFALVRDNELEMLVYLYHKLSKVGYVDGGKIVLSKKAKCLREMLTECKVPLA